jgi:hypothetical protein
VPPTMEYVRSWVNKVSEGKQKKEPLLYAIAMCKLVTCEPDRTFSTHTIYLLYMFYAQLALHACLYYAVLVHVLWAPFAVTKQI